MRIVFMGTPDFAVPALQSLADEHEIVGVYTREPKPSGRGNHLNKTPVHIWAENRGVSVYTPKSLRSYDEQQKLATLHADVAVVAAYGLILPKEVLDIFKLGCLNIHASLLPRWRGAAPIQRAIEAGDDKSGVTIMQIAEGLDTGDMLLKGSVDITDTMTGGQLHDALAVLGGELICKVLANLDKYPPISQDDNLACYAKKIEKNESIIDFSQPVNEAYNKIRAFSPFPGVYFENNGERFKVLAVEHSDKVINCGNVVTDDKNLWLGFAGGALRVLEIQRQGKRSMTTAELLRGYSFNK